MAGVQVYGPVDTSPSDCDYMECCMQFAKTIGIENVYQEIQRDRCFCSSCMTRRGDSKYYSRGSPKEKYALPIGWARVGLKIPAAADAHNAYTKWHRAFHGTKIGKVKAILEAGQLLMPGDVAFGGRKIDIEEGHITDECEGFDTKQIFCSPSMLYSGCDVYALGSRYCHEKSHKEYTARVAFQVLIRPGSYKKQPETIGAGTKIIDPGFDNKILEWSTKERGVTYLVGLLIKLE